MPLVDREHDPSSPGHSHLGYWRACIAWVVCMSAASCDSVTPDRVERWTEAAPSCLPDNFEVMLIASAGSSDDRSLEGRVLEWQRGEGMVEVELSFGPTVSAGFEFEPRSLVVATPVGQLAEYQSTTGETLVVSLSLTSGEWTTAARLPALAALRGGPWGYAGVASMEDERLLLEGAPNGPGMMGVLVDASGRPLQAVGPIEDAALPAFGDGFVVQLNPWGEEGTGLVMTPEGPTFDSALTTVIQFGPPSVEPAPIGTNPLVGVPLSSQYAMSTGSVGGYVHYLPLNQADSLLGVDCAQMGGVSTQYTVLTRYTAPGASWGACADLVLASGYAGGFDAVVMPDFLGGKATPPRIVRLSEGLMELQTVSLEGDLPDGTLLANFVVGRSDDATVAFNNVSAGSGGTLVHAADGATTAVDLFECLDGPCAGLARGRIEGLVELPDGTFAVSLGVGYDASAMECAFHDAQLPDVDQVRDELIVYRYAP